MRMVFKGEKGVLRNTSMSRFIDRRPNGRHKSVVNRQRFMQRFKKQIQEAVKEAISQRTIKNIEKKGEKIVISKKEISEPSFVYGEEGVTEVVLPGNKNFSPGDRIQKPPKTVSQGSGAGNTEENFADDFIFEISKEEFLDLFFEDLALPNLVKKHISKITSTTLVKAGFTKKGTQSNLSVTRTMKNAIARKRAMQSAKLKKIKELEELISHLSLNEKQESKTNLEKTKKLQEEIIKIKESLKKIPFIDPIDLKYFHHVEQNIPSTQAVMFCLMDVSGSMDEEKKEIAKRFFILLYLFLKKTYENVEIVFLRHHTSAKEVDEEAFFYSRETGGTVVSSVLELMKSIMQSRYSEKDWNIYAAQASDGDNWNNDSPRCQAILSHDIMPFVQYFAYVEIMPRSHQSLWESYLDIKAAFPHFSMQQIETIKDIYPVFRTLFKRRTISMKT